MLIMSNALPSPPLSLRWRTALIIRELESEVEALARGRPHRKQLKELMAKKEMVSDVFNQVPLTPKVPEDITT